MALWEQVLLGIGAAALLFFFWPAARAAVERSREAPKDWAAVLIPLALVVGFVVLLIAAARAA